MALSAAPYDSASVLLREQIGHFKTNLVYLKKFVTYGEHWVFFAHPIGSTICSIIDINTKNFLLLPPDSCIGYQRAWFHNDTLIMTPHPSNRNDPKCNIGWLQQCCFPSKNLGKLVTLLQTNSSTSRWLKKNAKRYRHRQGHVHNAHNLHTHLLLKICQISIIKFHI